MKFFLGLHIWMSIATVFWEHQTFWRVVRSRLQLINFQEFQHFSVPSKAQV